jgi:CIC family chloride channel protein
MVGLISRSDILRAYDVGLIRKQQTQQSSDRMTLRRVAGVEVLEVRVANGAGAVGQKVADLQLPRGTNLVSVDRKGAVLVPEGSTEIQGGDQITILCESGLTGAVRKIFAASSA